MNKKGFTLIELLVVIAIIGILSSVAIVYLSDARKKANDAKVSSNVTTAATQVEIDRANDLAIDTAAVIAKLGGHPCGGAWSVDALADGSSYAFYSTLCTDNTVYFCADSLGYRGTTTAALVVGEDGNCLANP